MRLQVSNPDTREVEESSPFGLNRTTFLLAILLFAFTANQWSRQVIQYLNNFTDQNPFYHMNGTLHTS